MKWTPDEGEWNPLAQKLPGRGLLRGKLERRPLEDITRIIVHHTGVGVIGRFNREMKRRPKKFHWTYMFESAVHIYTKIMNSSGHFLIGYQGELYQFVPEDWIAWHAGYGGQRRRSRLGDWFARMRFSRGEKNRSKPPRWCRIQKGRFQWWRERWFDGDEPVDDHVGIIMAPGHRSPLFWFPHLDVNRHTIGIELLSTPGQEPFPEAQLRGGPRGPGLRGLVDTLSGRYNIPIDEDHVLTHSDACPLARTTRSGRPYDPPPAKYTFAKVFGAE